MPDVQMGRVHMVKGGVKEEGRNRAYVWQEWGEDRPSLQEALTSRSRVSRVLLNFNPENELVVAVKSHCEVSLMVEGVLLYFLCCKTLHQNPLRR